MKNSTLYTIAIVATAVLVYKMNSPKKKRIHLAKEVIEETEIPQPEKHQSSAPQRNLASISQPVDPFLKSIEHLSPADQAQALEMAKKESMELEEFKAQLADYSKASGWDLKLVKTEDGHLHVRTNTQEKNYGDTPLPAYSDEDWVAHEENIISVLNRTDERAELTREDKVVIDKWK